MTTIGINPIEAGRKRLESRWFEIAADLNYFAEAFEEAWPPKLQEAAKHLREAALLAEQHGQTRRSLGESYSELFGPLREKPVTFMGGNNRTDAVPPTTPTSAGADEEPGR